MSHELSACSWNEQCRCDCCWLIAWPTYDHNRMNKRVYLAFLSLPLSLSTRPYSHTLSPHVLWINNKQLHSCSVGWLFGIIAPNKSIFTSGWIVFFFLLLLLLLILSRYSFIYLFISFGFHYPFHLIVVERLRIVFCVVQLWFSGPFIWCIIN